MVLVGFKKFKGKNGSTYNQLYATRKTTDFDERYSITCCGSMLETIWVTDEVLDRLNQKDIGKEFEPISAYVNGRNSIVDIKFV